MGDKAGSGKWEFFAVLILCLPSRLEQRANIHPIKWVPTTNPYHIIGSKPISPDSRNPPPPRSELEVRAKCTIDFYLSKEYAALIDIREDKRFTDFTECLTTLMLLPIDFLPFKARIPQDSLQQMEPKERQNLTKANLDNVQLEVFKAWWLEDDSPGGPFLVKKLTEHTWKDVLDVMIDKPVYEIIFFFEYRFADGCKDS